MILFIAAALAEDVERPPPPLSADCPRAEGSQQSFTADLERNHQQAWASVHQEGGGSVAKGHIKDAFKYFEKGELCTNDDRFWAGSILLLSTEQDHAYAAYTLGKQLVADRYPRGTWLAAQAYDRWAVAYGRMQGYGTQTIAVGGKRCLLWVDPQISDEVRKKYGYPSLAEVAATVLEANGANGAPATVAELKKRELWCKPEPWDGSRSDLQDPYGR